MISSRLDFLLLIRFEFRSNEREGSFDSLSFPHILKTVLQSTGLTASSRQIAHLRDSVF